MIMTCTTLLPIKGDEDEKGWAGYSWHVTSHAPVPIRLDSVGRCSPFITKAIQSYHNMNQHGNQRVGSRYL